MEEPKRRKGCWGCGIAVLVVLVLLAAWVAVVHFRVLEKVGLRQPASAKVFAPPPDREAGAALMGALQEVGLDTQGVDIYVLPMAGQDGSAAIVMLDASRGFDLERLFGGEGGRGDLEEVLDGDTFKDLKITRLAFEYVNEEGKSVMTLTAPTEALTRLSKGEIDEKEFLREVMGRVDIPGLIREVTQ